MRRFEVEEFIDAGDDRVVALGHIRAACGRGAVPSRGSALGSYQLRRWQDRSGRCARLSRSEAEALEAAGLDGVGDVGGERGDRASGVRGAQPWRP